MKSRIEKQRFSIRKYNVGVASVLIATAFSVMQSGNVNADENSNMSVASSLLSVSSDDSATRLESSLKEQEASKVTELSDSSDVQSNDDADNSSVSTSLVNDDTDLTSQSKSVDSKTTEENSDKPSEVSDSSKTKEDDTINTKKEVLEQLVTESNVMSSFVDNVVSSGTEADQTTPLTDEAKSELKEVSSKLVDVSKAAEVSLSNTDETSVSLSEHITLVSNQIEAAYVLLKKNGYNEISYVLETNTEAPSSNPYEGMTKIDDKFYASASITATNNYSYKVKVINGQIKEGDTLKITFTNLNPDSDAPKDIVDTDGTVLATAKLVKKGKAQLTSSMDKDPFYAQKDSNTKLSEKEAANIHAIGTENYYEYVFTKAAETKANIEFERLVPNATSGFNLPKVSEDIESSRMIKFNDKTVATTPFTIPKFTGYKDPETGQTTTSVGGVYYLNDSGELIYDNGTVKSRTQSFQINTKDFSYDQGYTFILKLKDNDMTKWVDLGEHKEVTLSGTPVEFSKDDVEINENKVLLWKDSYFDKLSSVKLKVESVNDDELVLKLVSGNMNKSSIYKLYGDFSQFGVERQLQPDSLKYVNNGNRIGYGEGSNKAKDSSVNLEDQAILLTTKDSTGNILETNVKSANYWNKEKQPESKTIVVSDYGKVALRFVDENGKVLIPGVSIVPSGNYLTDTYEVIKPTDSVNDIDKSNIAAEGNNRVETNVNETKSASGDIVKDTKSKIPFSILGKDGNYYTFEKFSEANKTFEENSKEFKSNDDKGSLAKDTTLNVVAVYKKAEYGKVVIEYVKDSDGKTLKSDTTTIYDGTSRTYNNIVGRTYDLKDYTGNVPKTLTDKDGLVYTLNEEKLPSNVNGTLTKEITKVVYRYNPLYGSNVIVKYEDDKGNKIDEDVTVLSNKQVGTKYDTTPSRKLEIKKGDITYVLDTKTPIKPGSKSENGTVSTEEQTITYVYIAKQKANVIYKNETTNATLETQALPDGKPGETITYADNDAKIKAYVAKGYELVTNGFDTKTTFDDNNSTTQEIVVTLKEGTKPVDPKNPVWPDNASDAAKKTELTKSITRTITYVDATTGKEVSTADKQTVTFTRTPILSKVTGEILGYDTNGDGTVDTKDASAAWTTTNDKYTEVVSPDLSAKGYDAPDKAKVEAKTVKASDSNEEVKVKYEQSVENIIPGENIEPGKPVDPNNPNGPKWPDSVKDLVTTKDVTRTIKYVYAKDNSQASDTVTQTANFERDATVNLVTGVITYGEWTSKNNTLESKTSPVITGYLADTKEVSSKTVTATDENSTVEVKYSPIGTYTPKVPEGYTPVDPIPYPNDPNDPTKPGVPTDPIPYIPGLTPVGPDGPLTPVDPKDPSKGYNPPSVPTDPTKGTDITYVKDEQKAVINYVTEDGKVLDTKEVSGKSSEKIDYSTADKIKEMVAKGYVLVKDNFPSDAKYDNDTSVTQTFTVVFKEATAPVTPGVTPKPGEPVDPSNPNGPKWPDSVKDLVTTKDVTRTIKYVYAKDNSQASDTVTQTANFERDATVNLVTGVITYGEWTSKNNTLESKTSPVITGYLADTKEVSSKTVTATDENSTVEVKYSPIGTYTPKVPEGYTPVDPIPYPNDPNDPTKPGVPTDPIPYIPGLTPVGPDGPLTPVDPKDPSKGYNPPSVPTDPTKGTDITYEKDGQTATIKYVTESGEVLSSDSVSGKSGEVIDYSTASKIQDYISKGYELVSDNFPKDAKYDNDKSVSQTFEVKFKEADGTIPPGTTPKPGEPVDPNNPNGPKWPDSVKDLVTTKDVTRTIKYVDSNGNVVSKEIVQTVNFKRDAKVNLVTGAITYGDWTSSDSTLPEVVSPDLSAKGYDAPDQAKVSSKTVTATDEDSTVVVTYKMKAKEEPKKPSKDDSNTKTPKYDGDKDNNPKHDDNTNKTPKNDENKTSKDGDNGKHHVEDRKITSDKTAASNGMMSSTSEQVLPNTGERSPSALSVLGVMALIGGLFATKRRKDEQ
ncbi:MAG: YSIRK-type signal peptide-containing protein [Streptococcus sp.]|nr:YSIRK-type signal peptide-containing protein [Streptococcus sp.]